MADNDSGGMTAIVAIVAIVIIIGIGFLAYRNFGGNNGGTGVKVEIPTATTGGGQQ